MAVSPYENWNPIRWLLEIAGEKVWLRAYKLEFPLPLTRRRENMVWDLTRVDVYEDLALAQQQGRVEDVSAALVAGSGRAPDGTDWKNMKLPFRATFRQPIRLVGRAEGCVVEGYELEFTLETLGDVWEVYGVVGMGYVGHMNLGVQRFWRDGENGCVWVLEKGKGVPRGEKEDGEEGYQFEYETDREADEEDGAENGQEIEKDGGKDDGDYGAEDNVETAEQDDEEQAREVWGQGFWRWFCRAAHGRL